LSSFRQNSARGGRGLICGFGLRIGGLGGLRGGAAAAVEPAESTAAPPPAAGVAGAATALDLGVADDALVDISVYSRQAVLLTIRVGYLVYISQPDNRSINQSINQSERQLIQRLFRNIPRSARGE